MGANRSSLIITGGAGFIGANLSRKLHDLGEKNVVVLDKLTYAGNLTSIQDRMGQPGFFFEQGDVCDPHFVGSIFAKYQPSGVVHLAAESHVDRSIDAPQAFIETNVNGTYNLLQEARRYLNTTGREGFKFIHVSTDEVFGTLGLEGKFSETTRYNPRSPYSASKAAADHLVMAWYYTFGLPVVITNSSNNFGPYQFPEKLIPVTILKALRGEEIPVYGNGKNLRDWLYVGDHVDGLIKAFEKGLPGQSYLFGAGREVRNIDIVRQVCVILNDLRPGTQLYESQITFVDDRPGHDFRYSIDPGKARTELGWQPSTNFSEKLRETIHWYLENENWWRPILEKKHRLQRLGTTKR